MGRTVVKTKKNRLQSIPSVDSILSLERTKTLVERHGRDQLVAAVRRALDGMRKRLLQAAPTDSAGKEIDPDALLSQAENELQSRSRAGLCRVINATGIVLHTGLGRAVLPRKALDAIANEQRGYSLLEVDRASGDRGSRDAHIVRLLTELTGAEDAAVVNNNAGATLIILKALAAGREVIVSRGQLVEIGGSFRIPEVMEAGGVRLIEVGTTNRTALRDYERRIGEETAALLRVHTSNFRVVGFTHAVPLEELVALGKKHRLPVVDDLGSGALVDLGKWGISDEPMVRESVRAGADLVCFSGDKLLGGPQAGLIVGKREYIAKIKKDPFYRALRVDKLTLTALETTLKLFLNPDTLFDEQPTLRMIARKEETLKRAAQGLGERIREIKGTNVEVRAGSSEVGGGSVPGLTLPTWLVALRFRGISPDEAVRRLRIGHPPVFARIQDEAVLFDVRTLLDGEEEEIVASVRRLLEESGEDR
ncbi:MAG: L-seryl-tRNA(Sec) selenium transferase [Planctomycetes bacterium RBG_16_59_8]|nr:MAG: L-seryl-tRNA(Sec) selenium transferase [Planctomycetes bacterium RBG_16_59_8]